MEEIWSHFCQILTFILFILFGYFGEIIAKEKTTTTTPTNNNSNRAFFHRYYDCIPILSQNGVSVDTTRLSDGKHFDRARLEFVAFGRQLTVDLSLNKHLFPASYVERVFQVNESGHQELNSTRQVPENCFYHGIVQGQPRSEAAISTCSGGISGYITDRRDTYHIEPLQGRVHRVYRNTDQRKLPFRCGTSGHDMRFHRHQEVVRRYKRSIRAPYDSNRNTRYVELYLVNDYRTFQKHNEDKDLVIQQSQDIANIVSSVYRQLNIYVALVGVEVWGAGDLITISKNADNTMDNFLRYRKERINPFHPNDNAQLITGKFFEGGVVGKAIKGSICTFQFSGGVDMDYGGPVTLVATTVAHEMGHNFGMEHDNDTVCECRDDKCIMAATSGQISPRHWSSCSQNSMAEALDLGMDYCLRNLPTNILDGPVCGNGFKEEGEECDCGLARDCTNRCCNPDTCQMYPYAECATGLCCDLVECKPRASSTMCREPTGECDLAEYCDGVSEYCPVDFFVQDGHNCQHGESYCYKGQCNTHTKQCQLLWGETGRVSDPICFQQLNMNGNEDGNCAYNWSTDQFTRCVKEDVLCGLLHCVHLNEKLMFWKESLALPTKANFFKHGKDTYVCRSAILDVGLDMKDPGLVPDGAKCEANKICIDQKCVSLARLNVQPCPQDCNGHGRCNSNNTCHCDIGYAPPLCDRPGFGGSVESGPATNEYVVPTSTEAGRRGTSPNTSTNTSSDSESNPVADKDLLVALLVVLILLIFVVLGILAYCHRSRLHRWLSSVPDIKHRVKAKTKKNRPQSLLDSSMADSRSESALTNGNPTAPSIWNPVPTKEKDKVPPKRPEVAPKRFLANTKSFAATDREQFSNYNTNFASSQPDMITTGNSIPSDNIPNSPKSSSKAIVKRESIRGSKISEPVLMSTTNRNSVVLADIQVDLIGPEADRDPRANSQSQRLKANHSIQRSNSDRQSVRPDFSTSLPNTNQGGGTLKKPVKPKPEPDTPAAVPAFTTSQPPPPPYDSLPKMFPPPGANDDSTPENKELLYINEMDMGGLLQDIDQHLQTGNVYCNLPNDSPPLPSAPSLEVNDTQDLQPKKPQPAAVNGVDSKKIALLPTKPKPESTTTQSQANNKSAILSAKDLSSISLKPAANNKPSTRRSANNPVEELKNRHQTKPATNPGSPKKISHTPSIAGKTPVTNKPATSNRASPTISNPRNTRTHNLKNQNNSQSNPQLGENVHTPKSPLFRTSSLHTEGGNTKSVSSLAACFNNGAEDKDSKPALRHNTSVSGATPNKGDKPGITPKPVPPPKPVASVEKNSPGRPTVKRVQSYRL